MNFPYKCHLCGLIIYNSVDLDWHGYGECVEITDEMWAQWEKEAEENKDVQP